MSKLWGGRFSAPTDKQVEMFTASLSLDARLCDADIAGCIAHARMLGRTGILPEAEAATIVCGLEELKVELSNGEIIFDSKAEDVHSEIERLLTVKVGAVAGKLHVARSRNDQVVTATRLYLRNELDLLQEELRALQEWFVKTSEQNLSTLMPGWTHFQHAQPVSLAHHLMAYYWMFQRDRDRLTSCRRRLNQLPLGAAALAGTSFPIDRESVRLELGFEGLCENSLDAVSDRDFIVEFLADASLIMTHLSRLAEELILWSSHEIGFVELSDSVTTGSSIMPQKKNPDVAELIRGRVGRVTGALSGSLMMLKALPLSYNRDLQEDKVHLFEGIDTTCSCVRLMRIILENATFQKERMARAVEGDFSNATDLADAWVKKGLSFRQAHEIVGKIVRECLSKGCSLESLTSEEFKKLCPELDSSVLDLLHPMAVLEARTSHGGTAPEAVAFQIRQAKSTG